MTTYLAVALLVTTIGMVALWHVMVEVLKDFRFYTVVLWFYTFQCAGISIYGLSQSDFLLGGGSIFLGLLAIVAWLFIEFTKIRKKGSEAWT